jgi:hypothetical protein
MRDSAALDGLLTYELGRNFWFYSGRLDYGPDWKLDSNGMMASWNGFFLPELLGLEYNPARVDSTRQRLHVMMAQYLDDADWTWKKVVETNTSPKDPTWGGEGRILFVALVEELVEHFGGKAFLRGFWHEAGARPAATSEQDAIDNAALTACAGAGKNLTRLFVERYKFVLSDAALAEAASRFGEPVSPELP